MTLQNCTRCRGETHLPRVDSVEGEAHSLHITLKKLPLLRCDQGHRQFVRPRFGAELLEHLTEEDEPGLPAGEEKGLLWKKFLCERCGEELEAEADHRHTFSIEIALDEVDPIGVELSMPVYRCSACGREQIHSLKEVRRLTPVALAGAFESARIPPPPGVI
jgi:hypothetical protein